MQQTQQDGPGLKTDVVEKLSIHEVEMLFWAITIPVSMLSAKLYNSLDILWNQTLPCMY